MLFPNRNIVDIWKIYKMKNHSKLPYFYFKIWFRFLISATQHCHSWRYKLQIYLILSFDTSNTLQYYFLCQSFENFPIVQEISISDKYASRHFSINKLKFTKPVGIFPDLYEIFLSPEIFKIQLHPHWIFKI